MTAATATRPAPAAPLGVTQFADGLYAVASSQPGAAPYRVERAGATFTCTCKSYEFSTADPKRCKHADRVRETLPVPAPTPFYCIEGCCRPAVAGSLLCARHAADARDAALAAMTDRDYIAATAGDGLADWLYADADTASADAPIDADVPVRETPEYAETLAGLIAATPTSVAPISINRTRPLRNPMPAAPVQTSATRAAMLARADAAHKADLASGNLWG